MSFPGFSVMVWALFCEGWGAGLGDGVVLDDAAPVGSGDELGDQTGLLRDKKEKQEEE